MSKLFTLLLILFFIPAILWGLFHLQQSLTDGFGAYTIPHTHTIEEFVSPMVKAALIKGFQASIALFILGIVARIRRIDYLTNIGFALGVCIFVGILLTGLLQANRIKNFLSVLPPAVNISSYEYSTEPDSEASFHLAYTFTWKKATNYPQEIQMYKTLLEFYLSYFSSTYFISFHTPASNQRCLRTIDAEYAQWKKQVSHPTNEFSVTCIANSNDQKVKSIILKPGNGSILFN